MISPENSTTNDLKDVYLLNLSTFRDSSKTIQGRFAFEKELDLFPSYTNYDLVIRYNQQKSLNRRSSELQTFFTDALAVDFRYNLSNTTNAGSKYSRSINRTTSNTISNRNFNIYSQAIEQDIASTLNRSWRTSFIVSYSEKEDRISTPNLITAKIVKIRNTNRFFLWRKIQANSSIEFRNVSVNGDANAVGKFELTEGSGEGSNLIWSFNSSYRVSNLIRLNLVYDGRTVKDRPDDTHCETNS